MKELRDAAEHIARLAGGVLRRAYDEPSTKIDHKTTPIDLVTETDRESEELILGEIARRFPGHAVLAEESGVSGEEGPFRWIVDPLDGTVNFAHRLPVFCVLITVQERSADGFDSIVGVTYDPMLDEMVVAVKGEGVTLNGHAICVSETTRLIDSMLATGFVYDRLLRKDDNHAEFCRLNLLSHGVRRLGSAGLDLAYVACGRLDASWEFHLKPWDLAAGILAVQEAGGTVTTIDNGPVAVFGPSIVASNGPLHEPLLAALASARTVPVASRDGLAAHLPAELADQLRRGE